MIAMQRDYWPTLDWQTATPKSVGMASEKLALLDTAIQNQYANVNGIIIVKNGHIAHEKYFRRKNAATMHNVASVTKSVDEPERQFCRWVGPYIDAP